MRFLFAFLLLVLLAPGWGLFGQSWTVYNPSNSGLPDGDLLDVLVDPAGKTWGVMKTSGLVSFDGTAWKTFNTSNSGLPFNTDISALSVDRGGVLYVGYHGAGRSGFYRFDGNSWKRNAKFGGLGIQQIKTGWDNVKWVCSVVGNHRLDSMVMRGDIGFQQADVGSAMEAVLRPDSLDVARSFSVAVDDLQEQVWFGVHAIGLSGYQTPMLVRYTPATDAWVLYPYEITYSPWPVTLDSQMPANLEPDGSGGIWSTISSRSLFHFDGTNRVQYTTANSGVPSDVVKALKLDAQGNLWVGTDKGLARFDGTEWRTFDMSNSSLPSNLIRAIDIDPKNQKWLATDKGLVVLNDIAPAIEAPAQVYLCDAPTVSFQDASVSMGGDIVRWAWDFGDGQGYSEQQNPAYAFKSDGLYTVRLTVWDEHGSTNSISQSIDVVQGYAGEVPLKPWAFTMSTPGALVDQSRVCITFPGVPVTFEAIAGIVPDRWDFGDGQSSTDARVIHAFSENGSYAVTLQGKDERACPILSVIQVDARDPLITDTVTPNGDGKNDRLFIEPVIYAAEIRVVNRWGQEVYSSADYAGGFSTGNLQDGFYYYEVSFKEADKQYKGYFQVIR